MFTNEELSGFLGVLQVGSNFVEIQCGCTLRRFGDGFGKLRVFLDGRLEIDCCCIPDCSKVKLSPVQFANHIGKTSSLDTWKNDIWVTEMEGNKVRLAKTCLLRYHIQTFQRPQRRPFVHRDEFIHCTKCNKERRFILRTKEQCKIYHKASMNKDWQCSDMQGVEMTCNEAEERKSRRPCRGCPRAPQCKGCIGCVCVGCNMCRFGDCDCRICTDYVQNMWALAPINN